MKYNTSACERYESNFKNIINRYSNHKNYPFLMKFAEKCLSFHTGFGLDAITAQVYMDEIIDLGTNNISELDEWVNGMDKLLD